MGRDSSSGLLRSRSSSLALIQRVLDVSLILLAMVVAGGLRDVTIDHDYLIVVTLASLLFLLFAEMNGVYKSWRTDTLLNEIGSVVAVWSAVVISLVVLAFAVKISSFYSRVVISSWALLVPLAMATMRVVYRRLLRAVRADGRNTRTVAFAGCGHAAQKMAVHINGMPWMGLKVLGAFDDRAPERLNSDQVVLLGSLQNLVRRARSGEVDIVYVTLPMHAERRIVQLVDQLSDTTASVFMVPDLFVFDLFNASWSTVAGMPVVSVYESPFYGVNGWLKRAEDVVLGGLILVLISPLLLLIALGIKLTSPGAVLFKQRRYGLKGEIVEVWKFRSMTVCDDGDRVIQAKKNDVRVTPFGAFLRRTSLDELPQFINVLQGQMSIVGPRPHAVAHNEEYRRLIHGYMLRHKVKPGITGWAQVNGWRGETDTLDKMQHRVDCDLEYVRNWSLWLDIKIILMTVFKGFVGKNVY